MAAPFFRHGSCARTALLGLLMAAVAAAGTSELDRAVLLFERTLSLPPVPPESRVFVGRMHRAVVLARKARNRGSPDAEIRSRLFPEHEVNPAWAARFWTPLSGLPPREICQDLLARLALLYRFTAEVGGWGTRGLTTRLLQIQPTAARDLEQLSEAAERGHVPRTRSLTEQLGQAVLAVARERPGRLSASGSAASALPSTTGTATRAPIPTARMAPVTAAPAVAATTAVTAQAIPVPAIATSTASRKRPAAGLGLLAGGLLAVGWWWRKRKSSGPRLDLQQVQCLIATGKAAQAMPLLQKALESGTAPPDEAQSHIIRCLLRQGHVELALQSYAKLDPSRTGPRTLYQLAEDFEKRGQDKVALELYAQVYLRAADLADVKARYERLKARQGSLSAVGWVQQMARSLPERYSQIEQLGEGGMGVVFKARDTATQAVVALKVISPLVSGSPDFLRRFRREIKVLSLLTHPGVVRILDWQTEPVPFYTMEFFAVPNLRAVLRDGALPAARVLDIGSQVAAAVAHAHDQGVVHRDIKPENVLVGDGDLVKVIDFGMAQVEGSTRLTRTGQAPGTLQYMAPEQMQGQKSGAPADLYSLGLLLYEMAAGQPAFGFDAYAKRLSEPPPPLPRDPVLGDALAALVAECTHLDPGQRPATHALVERLGRLKGRLAG